jgi:hypothetical protein
MTESGFEVRARKMFGAGVFRSVGGRLDQMRSTP